MARPSNSADALFLRTPAFRYLLAGALTLASCGLAAQEGPPPAAATQAEILHLDVSVNGRPRHLVAKFRRDPEGNFSSPRSELAQLGIRAPGSGAPQEEIALDAIDGLTYDYDAPAQKMNITLAPEAMAERVYGAASETQKTAPLESSFGGLLNYHLRTSVMRDFRGGGVNYQGASATFDARLFSQFGTIRSGAIVGSTVANRFTNVRLDTNWSYDDPERLMHYAVGDTITSGPAWARSIRLGGVQIQRNFGLRPDLVTAALPSISGSAAVPSTVDVYVNNNLTLTQPVDEGPFRIDSIPIAGNGETRVLTRDATGRVIETSTPFMVSSKIIKPGMWDWSFDAGLPRQYYAVMSDQYSRTAVASGSLRGGLLDWLTIEAHGETSSSRLANASAGVNVRLLNRAVATFAAGGSVWKNQVGGLFYASLETRLFGVSMSLSSQRTLGTFNDLASVSAPTFNLYNQPYDLNFNYAGRMYPTSFGSLYYTTVQPPRAIDRVSFGFQAPFDEKTSLNLTLANIEQGPGALSSQMVTLGATRSFFWDISAYLAVTYDFRNPAQRSIFAGLSMPIGQSTTVSTSFRPNGKNASVMVDAGRSIGQEPGSWGWRVRNIGLVRDTQYREASIGYRHEYGRVEAGASQMGRNVGGYADVEGAVAGVWGGGVGLSNSIGDAFAMVQAGAPGVQVLSENRPIGKTNFLGALVVPNLRAFEKNRLAIDVRTLPVNRLVAESERLVRPARGAGVAIDFAGKRRQAGAIVVLRDAKGAFLPAGTRIRLATAGETLVMGYDGRLWIPDPQPEDELIASLGMTECHVHLSYAAESGRNMAPAVCE